MIVITGLGPGDIARIPGPVLDLLLDEGRTVIVRTSQHPAAAQIAERRPVVFCDDLYESCATFEDVYSGIADRVITASSLGPVVYAVPGSPLVGEFAVKEILRRGSDVEVLASESFVDAILSEIGYDPFERGLQILNGHDLPSPLALDKPTIVGHLDRPEVLADVAANLSRVLPEGTHIRVLSGLGAADAVVWEGPCDEVDASLAGFRTSIWIDAEPGGLIGAVHAMRRLRSECPWDVEQTHSSLTKYLVEETFELLEAVSSLESGDMVAYARVEEEVGDVLLQVLFHAQIAANEGAFDIDDVAEVLRRKLVRRHPHVFADVVVSGAAEVKANWDLIKEDEKGESETPFDGVAEAMPALHRAAKIQNRAVKDGRHLGRTPDDLEAAISAIAADGGEPDEPIGRALFDLVDIARQRGVDPELALRRAIRRFESATHPSDSGS